MELSLCENDLKNYLASQLNTFFPDGKQMVGKDVDLSFRMALERLENCFKHITFPAYCTDDGQTHFSHLHADQYAQFLYFYWLNHNFCGI